MPEPDLLNLNAPEPSPDNTGGDPAVWTMLGEAGTNPQGQFAVGSTLVKRAEKFGKTLQDVATDPINGYEAWNDPKARARTQQRFPVGSPEYQAAQATLADLQSGKTPAASYTHFFGVAPYEQAHGKGAMPDWAKGQTGTDIGGNRFYTLPDQLGGSEPDLLALGGGPHGELPTNIWVEAGHGYGGVDQPDLTKEHRLAVAFLAKNGFFDPRAAKGSSTNPEAQMPGQGPPADPGVWYVTPAGQLRQSGDTTPDYIPAYEKIVGLRAENAKIQPNSLRGAIGGAQSLADVGQSINKLTGGALEATGSMLTGGGFDFPTLARQGLQSDVAERNDFNLLYGNDLFAGGARLAGQVGLTSLAGAGLGKGLTMLGPGGSFLAGEGSGALSLPSAITGGALQGLTATGLTSATSDQPLGSQLMGGLEFGGALGGGGRAMRGTANALFSPVGRAVEPFLPGGQGRILDRNLLSLTGGPTQGDFTEYVPGSRPTLAQATRDPNLAVTERTLKSSTPLAASAFADKANQNATARENYVADLTGSPQDLEALTAQREANTSQLRDQAFANKQPTDPTPVLQTIDGILSGPAGQRDAVKRALTSIRSKIASDVDLGNGKTVAQLETDPEQLYGIRQAIGDQLSPLSARAGSDAQLASRELQQVRDALDPVIEKGATGFSKYLDAYKTASKPIDALQTLQSLNMTDMRGNLTLGRVNSAITQLERQRAQPGANPAKSLTDEQMDALYNLRSDLQREDLTVPLGQAARSPTVTGNLNNEGGVNALMSPLGMTIAGAITHHPVGAAAVAVGKALSSTKQAQIKNMLIERLVNPDELAAPLTPGTAPANPLMNRGVLGRPLISTAALLQRQFASP